MHPLDIIAWLRMGRPKRGSVTSHEALTYPYEEGIETADRLAADFGDPGKLTVADLGAGPGESDLAARILDIPWRRLISVEAFIPYVDKLRAKKARAERHDILTGQVDHVFDEFKPGEIDLALLIDVLEHFPRWEALALLRRLESFFARGVVIFLPLGKVVQAPYDENELQRHRSSWTGRDLARLGYTVTVYGGLHGHLTPPADAAWAIKRWG